MPIVHPLFLCHSARYGAVSSFIARLARCLLGLLCLGTLLLSWGVQAQTIQTVAGNGSAGFSGDNGDASSAQLRTPSGAALDSAGNLYIADTSNHRIRKVDTNGTITTVAGNGFPGFSGDNGPASNAQLNNPIGVALDSAGKLYIADWGNHRIRKVDTNGTITTVAGNGTRGFSGDNGPASNAQLNNPYGVALDSTGNLYIADTSNHRIRKVDTNGTITTVAGNGFPGFSGDNGPASNAQLNNPIGVALDSAGNLYIADWGNHRIRKVDTNGTITTVAGNGTRGFSGDNGPASNAQLNNPYGVALDSTGNLYIADTSNHRIRKVDTNGTITTVAGNGTTGFSGDNGPASSAWLSTPTGVALDSAGKLYIADTYNHRIRKLVSGAPGAPGTLSAVAGDGAATITWAAPSDDGGSPITGYTVTASPASPGGTCTATPPATTCTISGLTNGTAYTFTVVATNAVGSSAPSAPSSAVTPLAPGPQVPGAPTGVTALAGDGAATLSWTAPSDDGGSPITGYTVTASPASPGGTCTATPPSTTCTISGLTNGTAYTFTVVASNAVGSSAPSAPSSAVTPLAPGPQVPGAPTGVTALAGDGAATLSWTAPSSDGGSPITGYTVTASPASPGGTCTATPPSTTCTISGLTNDTAYTFAVLATNAVGSGVPSAPSSAVTPLAALAQTLPLPGGAGNASVLISGGPPGCAVAAGDIAFSSTAPAGHPGTVSALGALAFTAKGCPGATLTISITYPAGSLNGLTPYKYGPKTAGAAPSWFAHGAISGDTVTYSVTDDGVGDNHINPLSPGVIEDPFAPLLLAAPPPATAQPIPTLGEWGLLLLSVLTAALGLGTLRRRQGLGV